jgi:septum formation protein
MKCKIILASASKRRSKILNECGINHQIIISNATETIDKTKSIRTNVLLNAQAKAKKVASKYKTGFIIGADTIVLAGKRKFGKPKTKKKAKEFLRLFSGKTLFVYTGLCIIDAKRQITQSTVEKSKIHVRKLSEKEISSFVRIASFDDKAGGFSIEGPGSFIFDNIQGSFYNILGLPIAKLNHLFKKLGINLLEEIS